MGSRLRKLLVAVIALSLLNATANAATKKPSPTPTVKVTTKATAKVTTKASASATAKTTAKPTSTTKSTAKPTAKTTASATATKKKVVYKPRPRKTVKVSPSPKAIWPPIGYVKNDDIYAKVPTSKELIGLSSANKKLASDLKACENLTCGAIFATSIAGCNWWEFTADVVGPTSDTDATPIKYGSLSSLFSSTAPKQVVPFLLISTELVKDRVKVAGIKISCHREPVPDGIKFPTHTYQKAN
mgnify:CR=1 FL=1